MLIGAPISMGERFVKIVTKKELRKIDKGLTLQREMVPDFRSGAGVFFWDTMGE